MPISFFEYLSILNKGYSILLIWYTVKDALLPPYNYDFFGIFGEGVIRCQFIIIRYLYDD